MKDVYSTTVFHLDVCTKMPRDLSPLSYLCRRENGAVWFRRRNPAPLQPYLREHYGMGSEWRVRLIPARRRNKAFTKDDLKRYRSVLKKWERRIAAARRAVARERIARLGDFSVTPEQQAAAAKLATVAVPSFIGRALWRGWMVDEQGRTWLDPDWRAKKKGIAREQPH
jgi:hypothetical protein